jgi:hypothetical protein
MPPRQNPRTFKAPRLAKETETTILRVDQYKDKDEGWKVRKKLMAQMDKDERIGGRIKDVGMKIARDFGKKVCF